MSQAFLDSSFLKGLTDAGTTFLDILTKIIENVGVLPTLFSAAFGVFVTKNMGSITSLFSGGLSKTSNVSFGESFTNSLNADVTALNNYKAALDSGMSSQAAFNATMQNASPAAQQFAQTVEVSKNSITQFTAQQKMAEVATMAQNKSFGNVRAILNEYNSGMVNCGLSQKQFTQSVSQGNAVLGGYIAKVGVGNATMTGYVGSLIAAKAASIGLKVATMALNAVIGMGIGLLMSLLSMGIQKLIEWIADSFKSAEERISEVNSRLDELSTKVNDVASKFKSLKDSVADVAPRFAELAKGVDEFGNNVSLTDGEYQEFIELNNKIAELFPELCVGMDSNGNAMLSLSYNSNTLTESLNELLEVQRKLANEEIAKNIPDVIDAITDYANIQGEQSNIYAKRIKTYKSMKEQVNKLYDNGNAISPYEMTSIKQAWGELDDEWNKLVKKYSKQGAFGLTIDWQGIINSEEFANRILGFEKQIDSATESVKKKWQSLASYMNAWVQTDDSFNSLNDDMQQVVSKMVSNLEFGTVGLKTEEEIKQYIQDKIIIPIQNASPEVQQAFSDLFNISADGKSVIEYINEIKVKIGEISNGTNFTFDEIFNLTGFDDVVNTYERDINRVANLLQEVESPNISSEEFIQWQQIKDDLYSLSTGDFKRAVDLVTNYGIKSWDELQSALENRTFDVVVDFSVEKEGLEKFYTAVKESVSSTGLSSDSISKLKDRYSELSKQGYDVSAMFEKTENGIHLNTKALRQLESEYTKQNKENLKNKLKGLKEQYNSLTNQIDSTTDAQKRATLYSQRNNVLAQIEDAANLASQYEGLTSAFYKWEQAQSMGEEGDMYDSLTNSLKDIKELYNEGLIGTNKFRAAVQLMSNEDLSTASAEELVAVYDAGYSKMTRYFTEGQDGCKAFLQDVHDLNSEWAYINEDGKWTINFGVGGDEKVADELGINVESVQALLRKMSDFSFDIKLDSFYSQYDLLKNKLEEANESLIEIGATDIRFNFNTDDIDSLEEQINQAKGVLDSLYDDNGELDVKYNESDVANITAIIEGLVYRKQSLDDAAILKVDTSNATTEIELVIAKLQEFRSAHNTLEATAAVGADTTEAEAACDGLLKDISGMDAEILAKLGIDTTSIETLNTTINGVTNEIMVDCGLDTSKIEDFQATEHNAEGTVTWKNNDLAITVFKNKTHEAKGVVKWENNTSLVSTTFTAKGRISEAQGTAHADGNWGAKKTTKALTGELGYEILVRNGKWFTIGTNGAEFTDIKKGDIIFSHEQSEMLLKNGHINSRGKSYASGTAYSGGNGGFFNGGSSGGGSSGGSSSSNKSSSSSKKSSSSSSKDEDDMDKIDWIEIAISRIENAIDKLKKTAESAYKSLKSRSTASVSEISKINEELALQQKAYDRYLQEANSVGLSEDLAERVRNGTIDINEYNSETRDLISEFQNWYEKAIDCSNAIDDLHESLAGLYEDNFKNIETDFENQLSLLEHLSNTYETNLDKLEAKGRFASQSYYTALNDIETKNIAVLNKELELLTNSFSEAMRSGEIEFQSEAWYSMQKSINDVKESIDEATLSILENEKAMRELDWSYFDYVQERIDILTQESNFLIGLMENSNLYEDNGQFNDKGMATLGLRTQNYNVYMAQADKYAQEMLKVSKELANDPYNKDLIERREELLKLQQDAISSAEDEKQAIVDLVKDGIDIELDSLKELIDARKDSLSSAKDLYEFEKKTKEQTAEIAKLQKTISAYSGDLSSETKAKVQKLTVDLANAQQSLEESQYDKFISDNEALLDNLYDEYESILNERLDNIDLLISDMIDAVNTNSASISQTLETESEKVGYTITDGMKSIWNNDGIAGSIVSKYGDNFTSQLTSVNQVLNAISAKVSEMVADSGKQIDEVVSNTTPVTEPINPPPPPQETKPEPVVETPPVQPPSEISIGGKINAGSAKIYTAPNGKALNQYFKNDPIYTVLEEKDGFLKVRYHSLTSGVTGWFKKSDVKAYKTGGLVDYTGLAQLDGTKEKPELVLNAADTENFIALRDVLRSMAKNTLSISNTGYSGFNHSMPNGIIDTSSMIAKLNTVDRISGNSVGDININIPIEHVEDYNDFVNQLKRDSQFEQLIQSMTIDRLVGGSSLAKNKFNWK